MRQLMKQLHELMTKAMHDGKRAEVFFAILEVVGEEDDVCNDEQEHLCVGTLIDRINGWLED